MFLAHYTGGGIDEVLDLSTDNYFTFLDAALKLHEIEMTVPRRVVLSGIEKR